tara:strand:+ start:1337 stop:1777 length:441 start_codon:yes stop_codon:yes gene_type:complete
MTNPLTQYKVSPEIFMVATEYVKTLDLEKTARNLDLTLDQVSGILDKKEVKRYVDAIFLEQGYMQRNKLNDVMTKIIDMKLDEMQESDIGSSKDILEILKLAHTMRMDHGKEAKEESHGAQVNINNNFGGDNYSDLLKKITAGSVI